MKLKARKVVQGFHQVYGRDFLETFSPVVGFDTLRIVMKMMVENGWQCRTMNLRQMYVTLAARDTRRSTITLYCLTKGTQGSDR